MDITIFTSNRPRHYYFINEISKIASKLNIIIENSTLLPGSNNNLYNKSKFIENYFYYVNSAQKKLFKKNYLKLNKNINLLTLSNFELSKLNTCYIKEFLKSDLYIIFGSSFIKNDLFAFLKNKMTFNIHMGISPYFRGADCNFWAIETGNPHLVGSTLMTLSDQLDGGDIFSQIFVKKNSNPYIYSMNSINAVTSFLAHSISNKSIFKIKPTPQDLFETIKYSTKKDFTENIVKNFMKKNIKINFRKNIYKNYDLINPYFHQ